MDKDSIRTIADIAELAGVSKSTVSRALNDSPLISDSTKEMIRAIADQHNFKINQPAQRLSTQQSKTIAFVTHGRHKEFCVEDLFQLEIMGAISRALDEEGYDLLMVHVDPYDPDWVDQYLDTGRVDGFILMTSTQKQTHIQSLLDHQVPFIAWGIPQGQQSFCSVTGDNLTGGYLATEHLIQAGRRRIAFIGGPRKEAEVQLRYQGYEKAMLESGLEIDPALVAFGEFSSVSGAKLTQQILEQQHDFDAVFANFDLMAIAAMNVLRDAGFRIPQDIAVVGYDDLSVAQHAYPPLTTISQNIPEAGRVLVRTLLQCLQTDMVTNVSIPVKLIVRGSSVPS